MKLKISYLQAMQVKAEELKDKGNLKFGNANYQEALDFYENALTITALITREGPDIGIRWISDLCP